MAGSRRSSTKPSTSYQEVDSDVDMNQEERVEARKAKAATAKRRNKAKSKDKPNTARESSSAIVEEQSKPSLSLDLVMALPLDVLAEICTDLDPHDLLNLCRTCRFWRELLLPRRARAIWAAARRREKLPLLADYNEIELAVLVFGQACWECAEKGGALDCYLRTRLCKTCLNQLVVAKSRAKSRVPSIHSRAPEGCLTTRFGGDDHVSLRVWSCRASSSILPTASSPSSRL
ncbi:hypothetical protein BCR35DRAFT_58537 [Leucosporidium creatinivorum]|uniref:F-box domain-containing protein n=1 Tax=Leucosporidium creatinivorum TaxID=106004 RepID=A0A1Y2FL63_9BASI|nr:hypothetical protein BCR35DRAFT_58537 [Leucosporidium creatinivorum]